MARRASLERRFLVGAAVLVCLAAAEPAEAQILRLGVEQVTLGWAPPEAAFVQGYVVLVSRNGGPDEVAAIVADPEVTLQANFRDVLVASVIAVGRASPDAPVTTSPRSPPSPPIHFIPALTWPALGHLVLHCASCGTLQVRHTSNEWEPWELPAFGEPWRLAAVGPISMNVLQTLWQDGESGELRLIAFGAAPEPPLAVSMQDLADFDVLGLAELDGDATREILLRHRSGTTLQFWKGADDAIYPASEILTPPTAAFAGAADFDGDGISEIWWQGDVPGQLDIWKVELSRIVGLVATIETAAAGDVARIADFDGDGAADVLWRDDTGNLTITYLTSQAGGASAGLAGTLELAPIADELEVLAAVDIDGLPGAEILLQHRDSYRVFAIAPSRDDLPPVIVLFDVQEAFELVHAQ